MKKLFLIPALLILITTPALASGGGSVMGTGGASEMTQLMNNAELVASVGQQANMVATQINQYVTLVAQLQSMKQNLMMLPLAVVGKALGPYKDQLMPYVQAYKAVSALQQSATNASSALSGEISAMSEDVRNFV